jgi:glutathione peroxidase
VSPSLYAIPLKKIDGSAATLDEHRGQVLLIVNVASRCGLTPQYAGLEKLYETYRARGFAVLGFPANDFAGQEPGSDAEIADFCTLNYGVGFPMYAKLVATGPDKHPLYSALTAAMPDTEDRAGMEQALRGYKIEPTAAPEVLWNFEKFLIGRDGRVLRRFAPDTAPDAEKLVAAVEAALAAD